MTFKLNYQEYIKTIFIWLLFHFNQLLKLECIMIVHDGVSKKRRCLSQTQGYQGHKFQIICKITKKIKCLTVVDFWSFQ